MSHYVHIHHGHRCFGVLGPHASKEAAVSDGEALAKDAQAGVKIYVMDKATPCGLHAKSNPRKRNTVVRGGDSLGWMVLGKVYRWDHTGGMYPHRMWFRPTSHTKVGGFKGVAVLWDSGKRGPGKAKAKTLSKADVQDITWHLDAAPPEVAAQFAKKNPGRLREAAGLAWRGDVAGLVRGGARHSKADAKKWLGIGEEIVGGSVSTARGAIKVSKRTARDVNSVRGMVNPAKKQKVIRSYTMDFTAQIEHAQRADGQWFKRIQGKDPRYGYKWGAWKAVPEPRAEIAQKHGEQRAIRLPKANPSPMDFRHRGWSDDDDAERVQSTRSGNPRATRKVVFKAAYLPEPEPGSKLVVARVGKGSKAKLYLIGQTRGSKVAPKSARIYAKQLGIPDPDGFAVVRRDAVTLRNL